MLIVPLVYLLFVNIICGVRSSSTNNTGFSINNQKANANTSIAPDLFTDEDETNSSGNFEYTEAIRTDKKTTITTSAFIFLDDNITEENELTNLRHGDETGKVINKTLISKHISRNISDFIASNTLNGKTLNKTTENTTTLNHTNTLIVPSNIKLEENDSTTTAVAATTTEVMPDSTFLQITSSTKKTPDSSSTSAASFFKSIKWYYWLLLSLIFPFIGFVVGVYCYFRHRQKNTGYSVGAQDIKRRNSTPSWVFSEPDFIDEELVTFEHDKK